MDMKTILGKLSALTSESLAMTGGSFKPGQGETAVDKQKCVSCGRTIQGRPRTTEDGDPICQACDDHYAIGGAGEHELDEDKMCETCGKPMEQCECMRESEHEEELDEVARNPYAIGMAQAMKQTGDEPPLEKSTIKKAHKIAKSIDQDQEELEEADRDKADGDEADGVKAVDRKTGKEYDPREEFDRLMSDPETAAQFKRMKYREEKELKESQCSQCHQDPCVCEEGIYESELADLRRLAECGDWMMGQAKPQTLDKMNVTTNMDSATGNQTVTVSAEGDSAQELLRILQMAGVATVAPAVMSQEMSEELANEPAPNTLDTATLMNQGEDLNRVKGQYNGDRARDNSMSMEESVARLAHNLAARFRSGK